MVQRSTIATLTGGYAQVAGFVAFTGGLLAVHAGSIVNVAYPLLAMALAFMLFVTYRNVYMAFTWWIWLFTPLVRRLVDFQTGYHQVSPVMLAPLMVTSIGLIPLLRNPRILLQRMHVHFLLAFMVYVYALTVGLVLNSLPAALFDFAGYTVPLGFALALVDDHRRFHQNRAALVSAMIIGLFFISAYGLYQFYHMPPWDQYWLNQSHFASAGAGIAEQIRLFGPLNSPGPFAIVLMASLVLVLVVRGPIRVAAGGLGFPAFGLALVRSAWGGWALATLIISACVGGKARIRLILIGFALVIVAYPLVTVGPVADAIQKRFATFNNIQQDGSYQARQRLYKTFTIQAISEPIGIGFGGNGASTKLSTVTVAGFDSGVLQVPFQFGWVFGPLYVISLFLFVIKCLGIAVKSKDTVSIAGAAIFLVMLLESWGGNIFSQVLGMTLWTGAAMALGEARIGVAAKVARRAVVPRRPIGLGMVHEN